jgi:RNA polymerase sigma-70 factor (ECF subfamily)
MNSTGADAHGQAETADARAERELVEALRNGDEAVFEALVSRLYPQMLRIAAIYVPTRALAEEVVQEAWLGVLRGLDRFEARASLRTWIFRILTNCAKTRGVRERRSIPFSDAWNAAAEPDEPSVDPDRFLAADHPRWPGHWVRRPESWGDAPEEWLLSRETLDHITRAIAALPPAQREVITLRDVEGWTAGEVCQALNLSDANQRVLLHRARAKVRNALENYFKER